jgi:large subunit ribosomal protein L3
MTQIFDEEGRAIPVTVIQAGPCTVTQIKTKQTDGYVALQVGYGEVKPKALNEPKLGHLAKSGTSPVRHLHEYRLDAVDDYQLGQQIKADIFSAGQLVNAIGTSIGKGFAGGIKRHHFSMQDATHGNSRSHRVLGSIGMCQTPGRVFKGKKMEGHLGNVKTTIQNLTIHAVDTERNLILVKGAVPGAKGGDVVITPAIKLRNKG